MYANQGLTPNIRINTEITKKPKKLKSHLLSNPKVNEAQKKIENHYRENSICGKSYISNVVKQLKLTHIDKLNTAELQKFNSTFFKKDEKTT